tara:strand:- start:579 stop:1703 length:1125 start_codon:yes stop_codon:yes gene_type:complete
MSELPSPSEPQRELPAYAARMAEYIEVIMAMFDASLAPGKHPTSFSAFHPHHSFHRLFPRMQHRFAKRLEPQVKRMEYMLRTFILWMAGLLVEKARADQAFYSRLLGANDSTASRRTCAIALARNGEAHRSQFVGRSPERALCETNVSREQTEITPAQLAGAGSDEQQASNHPQWLLKEDQLQADMAAGRVRIGGFSVTTPHNLPEAWRRPKKRRVQRLRPDPLEEIDVPKLFARIARLPRVLKRADKMAERLARKALNQSPRHIGERGFRGEGKRTGLNTSSTHIPNPSPSEGEEPTSPHNPLYFKPLEHWLPPEPLYYSTEDKQERDDFNMLHLKACEVMDQIGLRHAPGEAAHRPCFQVFEPPPPPRITII